MGTLNWCRNVACKTAEEAIEKLYGDTHSVILYHSNEKILEQEISKLFKEIKARNAQIEDIEEQMLPTNSYRWDDIDGCLAVKCAEISMRTFKENSGCLALFTGFNYSVLSKPDERRPLSPKAMSSLAMLGSMVAGGQS